MRAQRFVGTTISIALMMGAGGVSGQTTSTGSGQAYPNKSIRIVTAPAGGGQDFEARLVAQGISGPLGQAVIVENRPGGVIGDLVVQAQPDGYTLALVGSAFTFGPLLRPMTYDPIKDFSPVTSVAKAPNVLAVHASVPANSVTELIALAKAKPGTLNYATGPSGGTPHLSAELFKSMTGVNIVRIPYKGGVPALNGVLSGESQMMFVDPVAAAPHAKAGKVKVLGVTSLQPTPLAPGVPTIAASGLPGFDMVSIDAVFVPAKTPAAVIKRLNEEIVRVLSQQDVREKLFATGVEPGGGSPEQLAATTKSEIAKIGKLIKDGGIKAD